MAGVTLNGFETKRLPEIITGLKTNARTIFQDLVPPGEEVDVGDTSALGRIIGVVAPDFDELWQAAHQVYQAFDPNSAQGVALDNVVQYIGVQRRQGRSTVLRASVWGERGVSLASGQVIRNATGDRFISESTITFTAQDVLGCTVVPVNMTPGLITGLTIIVEAGIFNVEYTIQEGDTIADVVQAWADEFAEYSLGRVDVHVEDGELQITALDYFGSIIIPALTNSATPKIKKRLTFNSEEYGDIPAPLGTVTTILTPVYGWLSVINEVSATPGTLFESDQELRERFRISKAVRATNTSEALYSQLVDLEGVTSVRIMENMLDVEDFNGIPPHSFMAIVRGGDETSVGEIVWNNKPLGIGSHGNTTVAIKDSQGLDRTVQFSRPTDVPIYVNIVIRRLNASMPNDATDLIRNAVKNYLDGAARLGEDVIYTRLFTPINSVQGHQVETLEIGRSLEDMVSTNLEIDWDEYPVTLPEYINVTLAT